MTEKISAVVPRLLADGLKALRSASIMPRMLAGLVLRMDTSARDEDTARRTRRALILSMAETVALHYAEPRVGDSQGCYEANYKGYGRASFAHHGVIRFPVNLGDTIQITHASLGAGGRILAVLVCKVVLTTNDCVEVTTVLSEEAADSPLRLGGPHVLEVYDIPVPTPSGSTIGFRGIRAKSP